MSMEIIWKFHFASISCDRFKMKSFHFALIVGILYFITFCVDDIRFVPKTTRFVLCYDR